MFQRVAHLSALCALLWLALTTVVSAADWLPVSPEELRMTREPLAPTASAIYLYRQVDRNDANAQEFVYVRIKVLTEDGRAQANIEIPYTKDRETIRSLRARTLRPDGAALDFDGTVYEKQLVKARDYSMMSKSFTLPGVEVGSIIEYQYLRTMPYGLVYDSKWLVSANLFTKHAVFSLKPSPYFLMRWSWPIGLPNSAVPAKQGAFVRYETRDVPAFVTEDYMPPEDAMKYRVEFIYEGEKSDQTNAEAYWKAFGKELHQRLVRFVKEDAELVKEVARLVQPGDNAEAKARKLYARAQQLRNLTFERYRTEEELKREKIRENHDAEDVLEHGYASADDVTWTLYGLLRAAKLDASIVFVPPRDRSLFDPRLMNASQLSTCVVLVNLDDGAVFLDPGVPLMPFALLPWSETAISGFMLTPGGGKWVNTSLPSAGESRVERKAVLKLAPNGTLSGTLTVTYVGLEAAWRRLSQRNSDATARKKFLEGDVEDAVPSGIDVKLTNEPDWASAEAPLVAQYDLTVGGWAAGAGNRLLLPVGLFSREEQHLFEHSARVHPLYFHFLYQHSDDISIELPAGWQVTSVPQPRSTDIKIMKFGSSAKSAGATLNLTRQLELGTVLVNQKFYETVRGFYQAVRAGDEEQIVVTAGPPPVAATH